MPEAAFDTSPVTAPEAVTITLPKITATISAVNRCLFMSVTPQYLLLYRKLSTHNDKDRTFPFYI